MKTTIVAKCPRRRHQKREEVWTTRHLKVVAASAAREGTAREWAQAESHGNRSRQALSSRHVIISDRSLNESYEAGVKLLQWTRRG
jgi:hypothetical protein